MHLGIDASNLRSGGAITHLVELLRVGDPISHGFSKVFLWGEKATLDRIESRAWLVKDAPRMLERNLSLRLFWKLVKLPGLAQRCKCDVLFVPGGLISSRFRPVVTMSRNMLPFQSAEMRRYRWSLTGFRLLLLRWIQARAFSEADGLIFLTQFAFRNTSEAIKAASGAQAMIPHGVCDSFFFPPRQQLPADSYSIVRPFRLAYVSIIDLYKHQWHVVTAVSRLRSIGLPITLELIGPAYSPALKRLKKSISDLDPADEFVRYLGPIEHKKLPEHLKCADAFVFASSCENMPNILLESMAAGLPIACSDRGPMPEVLGDSGVFFNPENPDSIVAAIETLYLSHELRAELAESAFVRAHEFTWEKCANETFRFLAKVAKQPTKTLPLTRPA